MPEPAASSLLQICPNDHPPFLDICRCYHEAALSLGMASRVVFLGETTGRQDTDFEYLNNPGFKDTAKLVAGIRRVVADNQGIVVCHRHRAYWVWLRSGLQAHKVVALAHEFGFFGRLGRRLAWRFLARDYLAGGVSEVVLAELARTTSRTLLLPNAIDTARPLLDRDSACAALGLHPDRINIGLVGRLHPKKRPDLALRAFAVLRSQLPDAHMAFIGDGELEADLRSTAADLPVTFCGRVFDASTTFKALDVLLISSTDDEAFGMVVLEAMRAGVPVVSGQSPGPKGILGSLGTYYAEDTPQAIATALIRGLEKTDQEAHQIACREVLKKDYSIAAIARRLETLRY